jgi:hypothetical protein
MSSEQKNGSEDKTKLRSQTRSQPRTVQDSQLALYSLVQRGQTTSSPRLPPAPAFGLRQRARPPKAPTVCSIRECVSGYCGRNSSPPPSIRNWQRGRQAQLQMGLNSMFSRYLPDSSGFLWALRRRTIPPESPRRISPRCTPPSVTISPAGLRKEC